jgi:predicted metal-dependent hydrolase
VQLGLPFGEAPAPERTREEAAESAAVTMAPPIDSPIAEVSGHPIAPLYFVRHRRARRYRLRVEIDGRVRVTIPRGGSRREADAFARRQVEWVARQRAALSRGRFSADDRCRLRARARAELPGRLHELAAAHGLRVTHVSVRNQRTRWGSCGRDGHICLNWRLVAMPDWVRDYVMIHELMHLERLDHSAAYWRLVAAACPRFREARHWLRVHGPELR